MYCIAKFDYCKFLRRRRLLEKFLFFQKRQSESDEKSWKIQKNVNRKIDNAISKGKMTKRQTTTQKRNPTKTGVNSVLRKGSNSCFTSDTPCVTLVKTW